MHRHLETLGQAVTRVDLALIPMAVRWAYESGASPAQVCAVIEGSSVFTEVPAAVRTLALDTARAWAGLAHRHATA